jgi:hypothetical protein
LSPSLSEYPNRLSICLTNKLRNLRLMCYKP